MRVSLDNYLVDTEITKNYDRKSVREGYSEPSAEFFK